jgi:hypothetical protein
LSSYSRQQLESHLQTLNIKANNVLDIGGSVSPVHSRVKTWDVKNYYIMDNDNEKDLHDKWKKPDFTFDINEPELDYSWYANYDLIFMLEVSEYLYNPFMAVQNIYDMLETGGKFIGSFHFIYPIHEPVKNDYMRYTRSGIEKLFEKFKKVRITPRFAGSGELLREFYSAEGMRASKNPIIDHTEVGYMVEATK